MGATSDYAADLSRQIAANNPAGALLSVAKAIYSFGTDGGVIGLITPRLTASLPKNAVIVAGTVNSTTAVTSAGTSATALLAATAKATLSANALVNAVPVFATPVKLSAAGLVTVTVGTAALTAGVVEITLFYFVANS